MSFLPSPDDVSNSVPQSTFANTTVGMYGSCSGGATQAGEDEFSGAPKVPASEYHKLLREIFDHQPVLRGATPMEVMLMGTVDAEAVEMMSKSIVDFKAHMLEQEAVTERASLPYASFVITDFYKPLAPHVMETAATLLVQSITEHCALRYATSDFKTASQFESRLRSTLGTQCASCTTTSTGGVASAGAGAGELQPTPLPTFIVSVGMRGAGALAQSVALRIGVPFSLSNWYPDGSVGDVRVDRCEGIGGAGWVYLNGVPPKSRVAVVMDLVRTGASALRLVEGIRQIEGCVVTGVYTVADIMEGSAQERLRGSGVDYIPLVTVSVAGERSCIASRHPSHHTNFDTDNHRPAASPIFLPSTSAIAPDVVTYPQYCSPARAMPSSTVSIIKRMPAKQLHFKQRRVASSFAGVPILYNSQVAYPYCFFALTDFKPALDPTLVEDMADLAVYYADFEKCDVLVSEGDRGGGPLLQAIAVRVHRPYVMASWTLASAEASGANSEVTHVGFSGQQSQLSLSGLRRGMRCAFVDDMLSSGGTADAVLQCVKQLGALALIAVFASEKLYPKEGSVLPVRKGKNRLQALFPDLDIVCLAQFVVKEKQTEEPPCRVDS